MPDERPDDQQTSRWLPPTEQAYETWLPPSDAAYTPAAPDPYPSPRLSATRPRPGAPKLGKATASLALAVVGLFILPIVFSIAAIVVGTQARREIDAAPAAYANRGQAQWGVNLGWVGLAFGIVLIALFAAGVELPTAGV